MRFFDPRLNVAVRPFDFKRGIDNLGPELFGEMEVAIYPPRTRRRGESCCVMDVEGRRWRYKVTKNNIKLKVTRNVLLIVAMCNAKVYYTTKDSFHVEGKHIFSFDHERGLEANEIQACD